MSTGVRSFSRSTCRSVRMRATNGVSEKRPSNVTTAPSMSTSPTGRRRWSWSAIEIICRSERHLAAVLRQQLVDVDRLEAARLEVDDVGLLRRVARGLVRRLVHPQAGLAGGDEHRVVVGQPVDGARAEAGDDPQQPVLALDPRRPAELVVREPDARERGQPVRADARADDLLDEDAHLLVEVEEPAARAVLDRVGAEDGGVHLGDRVRQRGQALALRAGVRRGRGSCTCPRRRTRAGPRAGSSCAR